MVLFRESLWKFSIGMLVSRRLTILSAEEIEDLYSLPRFTEDDRHLYFDLSVTEHEAVATVHTLSASAQLILCWHPSKKH